MTTEPVSPEQVEQLVKTLRQGDVFELDGMWLPLIFRVSVPLSEPSRSLLSQEDVPNQLDVADFDVGTFVIVSQTCDLRRGVADEPLMHIAPVIKLDPGTVADDAALGRTPRYPPIPDLGEHACADLTHIATVEKGVVWGHLPVARLSTSDQQWFFSRCVSRHLGRVAFDDDTEKALKKFGSRIVDLLGKDHSELAVFANKIRTIRLKETPTSDGEFLSLSVYVIVDPHDVEQSYHAFGMPPEQALESAKQYFKSLPKPTGRVVECNVHIHDSHDFSLIQVDKTAEWFHLERRSGPAVSDDLSDNSQLEHSAIRRGLLRIVLKGYGLLR